MKYFTLATIHKIGGLEKSEPRICPIKLGDGGMYVFHPLFNTEIDAENYRLTLGDNNSVNFAIVQLNVAE